MRVALVLCALVLCALVCNGQIVHVNDTLIRRQLSDAVARPKQVYYHSAHKKKVPADADGTKYMALTFDDGPHQTLTPRLLDILKEKKAKATFYVMGVKVAIHPEIVARAALEGHEIGNHVYDHPVLTKIKPQVQPSVRACTNAVHLCEVYVYLHLYLTSLLPSPPPLYRSWNIKSRAPALPSRLPRGPTRKRCARRTATPTRRSMQRSATSITWTRYFGRLTPLIGSSHRSRRSWHGPPSTSTMEP